MALVPSLIREMHIKTQLKYRYLNMYWQNIKVCFYALCGVGWAGGGEQVASYIPGGSKISYNIWGGKLETLHLTGNALTQTVHLQEHKLHFQTDSQMQLLTPSLLLASSTNSHRMGTVFTQRMTGAAAGWQNPTCWYWPEYFSQLVLFPQDLSPLSRPSYLISRHSTS